MTEHVAIFDTTLRDGEQSPGASMTRFEKLRVARALTRLRVDVIEAGFPAASPDDARAVHEVAEQLASERGDQGADQPIVCALARAARTDIECAAAALVPAVRPRIHVFLATSPIHREYKLKMSRTEVVSRTRDAVTLARSLCDEVEFSPEDAGRTEVDFLHEVLEAALEAGASVLNIPDTVGYTVPEEFGAMIAGVRAQVRGIERATISVHCHDDLGLAVANTLAGLSAGARQAEVTVNGIGERAGNAALEAVVMAIRSRSERFGLETGVRTEELVPTSQVVSEVTGMLVPPCQAVVGLNAFSHEAGIHQHGVLANAATYEIMRPETVGAATRLVLGKHSGRHALRLRLNDLGFAPCAEELDRAFTSFKVLADRKKTIADDDLKTLMQAAEAS